MCFCFFGFVYFQFTHIYILPIKQLTLQPKTKRNDYEPKTQNFFICPFGFCLYGYVCTNAYRQ